MAWTEINKAPLKKGSKRDIPEGLWVKCENCGEIIYRKDFMSNLRVCPKCHFHFPMPARERIQHFCDSNSFVEEDVSIQAGDPLGFTDSKSYAQRLSQTQTKTGEKDAFISGRAFLKGLPVQVGVFNFQFMGGSMGSVVGEKITRLLLRSKKTKQPAILFSTSGGARMQEGILSLMQMAKTCSALSLLREEGVPMISIMTHPTTGGVAASYAMLGDINIGEPNALIGFAGPRVIKQVINQDLPEGFQRSEYLLEHGMLDLICHRDALRDKVAQIVSMLLKG